MSVHVVLNAQALRAMLCFQAEFDGKKMVKAAEERMVKSMDKCKENMATLRTGAIQHNTASTLQYFACAIVLYFQLPNLCSLPHSLMKLACLFHCDVPQVAQARRYWTVFQLTTLAHKRR
jgi:hypothetical protein